jgi:hypothetical protein
MHNHNIIQYNCSLEYFGTHSTVYFSYWWKHDLQSSQWSGNVKPWIEYGERSGMWPVAYIGFGSGSTGDAVVRNSVQDSPSPSSGTIWGSTRINHINAQWVRIEQYLEQSSPSVENGTFMTWIHKPYATTPQITFDLNSGENAYMTRGSSDDWRQWHFGSYFTQDSRSPDARAYIYIDDLYFDTTRARVEIGDAGTWNTCTHREIQVPTSWSSNSITVTVNQGGFPDAQEVYLYVVDAEGAVNSAGYPVTVGDITYALTVTNGSGSGSYDEDDVVPISANPPPSGKAFGMWIGDFTYVADRFEGSTTVTMPAGSVSVTATYRYVYQLTVNSGSGDGEYPSSTIVSIDADAPPSGAVFDEWVGDVSSVADPDLSSTTVTMPSDEVEVTATYVYVYQLTVNSGSGDGTYLGSTVVPIAADAAPSGTVFTQWVGDTTYVAVPDASSTTVTMPSADVEVTARYKLRGDLNVDGFVGQTDLDIVLDEWGSSGGEIVDPRADPNEDDFVGQTDLDIVLDQWGQSASP